MFKHAGTVAAAGAPVVLMVILTATSSLAAAGAVRGSAAGAVRGPAAGAVRGPQAADVKVSPGGPFTATSGKVTFTVAGNAYSCGSSKATGSFKKRGSGTHIGRINSLAFSKCKEPTGISFTITGIFPWYINVTGINQGKGEVSGTISSMKATVAATGCSFTVAGASASVGGTAKMTYTNSTAELSVLASGGTLHVWDVSGCLGVVSNGDPASYNAVYTVNPAQTIS
jgi:hypothetical protein